MLFYVEIPGNSETALNTKMARKNTVSDQDIELLHLTEFLHYFSSKGYYCSGGNIDRLVSLWPWFGIESLKFQIGP